MTASHRNREGLDREPFWYKSGVIYEVHVRAFFDTNADGTGDFRGLTEKLDYIKDLGVTAIWLLPFFPSPGPAGHYRTGAQPHVRPASLVPARAPLPSGQSLAQFLRLERHGP